MKMYKMSHTQQTPSSQTPPSQTPPSLAPSQTPSHIKKSPSLGGGTPSLAPPHPRDALIEFDAGPHKYTCAGEAGYMSVTTWNHTHFPKFDADAIITKMMSNKRTWLNSPYYGKTREEIKAGWDKNRDEAAAAGTAMHYAIECYYRGALPPTPPDSVEGSSVEGSSVEGSSVEGSSVEGSSVEGSSVEGSSVEGSSVEGSSPEAGAGVRGQSPLFVAFLAAHPHLKPYRTEWMIFNEDIKLAGSVDMVYENESDGSLMIYDWKRCKDIKKTNSFGAFALTECISHLPDTNFWHYALQLNTYKAILEAKYEKKVSQMCLVCLHPNLPTYEIHIVPELTEEMADLFALRRADLNK